MPRSTSSTNAQHPLIRSPWEVGSPDVLALSTTSQEGTPAWEDISWFTALSYGFFQLLRCWLKRLLSLTGHDCHLWLPSAGDQVGPLEPLSIQRSRSSNSCWADWSAGFNSDTVGGCCSGRATVSGGGQWGMQLLWESPSSVDARDKTPVSVGLWFSAGKCASPKVALYSLLQCWQKDSWIK